MNTLDFIVNKYYLDPESSSPIEIPNTGRNDLAKWLTALKFKLGVEVGVAAGEYAEELCKANPAMKFYEIDPWIPYRGYRDYTRKSTFARLYGEFQKRMVPYSNYEVIKDFSAKAARKFENDSLDFVYLDANHGDPFISEDLAEWYKKVKPGRILAGHDYVKTTNPAQNVVSAVNLFTQKNNIKPWFILGTNTENETQSWMIIKEQK